MTVGRVSAFWGSPKGRSMGEGFAGTVRRSGFLCGSGAATYGRTIVLRAVTTDDFMTAEWTRLPYEVLERASNRITNEVPGISRVVYDITSKPPATVEWE